ncbi:MAG: hypothetical protein ACSHX7_06340 [Luteolibacter sp.]
MARRASSSTNPVMIIGIVAAVVALFFAGKFFLTKKSSSFGDTSSLTVQDLLDNGNSLRGSEYVVEGSIDEKLRWTPNHGQIVSLRVETPTGDEIIPIRIPDDLKTNNIEREQRYAFKVEFEQGGIPVATGISRL